MFCNPTRNNKSCLSNVNYLFLPYKYAGQVQAILSASPHRRLVPPHPSLFVLRSCRLTRRQGHHISAPDYRNPLGHTMNAQVDKIIFAPGYRQELIHELHRKPTRSHRPRGIYWSTDSWVRAHLIGSPCLTRPSGTPVLEHTAREPAPGKNLTMPPIATFPPSLRSESIY